MKLGLKIILPILLLLVIILGAFGYLLYNLKQQEAVISVQGSKIQKLNSLNERLVREQDITVYNVLAYRFNQDRSFLLAISQAELDKSKTLDEMYPFITTSRGRELVNNYIDSRLEIESLRNGLIKAIDEGDKDQISLNYNKWSVNSQNIKATLADIGAYNINSLEKTLASISVISNEIAQIVIILAFVVIATIMFLYFYLRVVITAPIIKLAAIADQLAKADFTTTINVNSKDEIGELAYSFNEMSKKLKESYQGLETKVTERTQELVKAKHSVEVKVEERTGELKEAQARLQSSIQSLRVGFIITDNLGKIMAMNGSAKLILLRKKLISGEKIDTSMYRRDWDIDEVQMHLGESFDLQAQINTCISEMKPIETKEIPFGERYLRIFITPVILYKEKQIGIIGTAILIDDITEAKILERSRDEFFSIASHELRTPLTALRGNSLLLKQFYGDKIKDKDFQEMVSDMHEATVRLIGLVNDFLDVSRLEQGKIILKKEKFDLAAVIKDVMHEIDSLVNQKKLQVIFDLGDKQNLFVFADQARVKQVLTNLLGNAIAFTNKGFIRIDIEQRDEFLLVRVIDSGKGISRKNQNLLFRKFQQAGDNILTRDVTRGTGLGLYISKLLVEEMGGDIYLEKSQEGKGSTFVFTLPITGQK